MNKNPIICNPDSEDAVKLIGREVEGSFLYPTDQVHIYRGILEKIEKGEPPFLVRVQDTVCNFNFIREYDEELSEKLKRKFEREFNDFCTSGAKGIKLFELGKLQAVFMEAIERLKELGE
jgi:hypothetical protein